MHFFWPEMKEILSNVLFTNVFSYFLFGTRRNQNVVFSTGFIKSRCCSLNLVSCFCVAMPAWKMPCQTLTPTWAAQSSSTREAQTPWQMAAGQTARLQRGWPSASTTLKGSSAVMWHASLGRSKWGFGVQPAWPISWQRWQHWFGLSETHLWWGGSMGAWWTGQTQKGTSLELRGLAGSCQGYLTSSQLKLFQDQCPCNLNPTSCLHVLGTNCHKLQLLPARTKSFLHLKEAQQDI